MIPPNVRRAVNFYERRTWWLPFLMGSPRVRAEDPQRTQFLGNRRVPGVSHFGIPDYPEIRGLILDAINEAWSGQAGN